MRSQRSVSRLVSSPNASRSCPWSNVSKSYTTRAKNAGDSHTTTEAPSTVATSRVVPIGARRKRSELVGASSAKRPASAIFTSASDAASRPPGSASSTASRDRVDALDCDTEIPCERGRKVRLGFRICEHRVLVLLELQEGVAGEHITTGRVLNDEQDFAYGRTRREDIVDVVSGVVDRALRIERRFALIGNNRVEGSERHSQNDQHRRNRPRVAVDPLVEAVALHGDELRFVFAIDVRIRT